VTGNLVRWLNGPAGHDLGEVVSVVAGRVHVRLDTGEERAFVWPSEVLEPLVFAPGRHVRVVGGDEVGVVAESQQMDGRRFYVVNLPQGVRRTVMESGLRPAVITDPEALLRSGELDFARSVNLRVAATRLLFAHQFDELSSLSTSRVEIKPHQVGVVHRVVTSYPHRFLLADEVGLGKTIEAGLIIKELKARGLADRVLVLAPPNLVTQWQYELKTKFNEVFAHYNSQSIAYLRSTRPGDNVWTLEPNVICSTSYAAWDERRREEIALAGWDLVVIDEAHHARLRWRANRREGETNLYRLAARLADPELALSSSMLLLTATPMQLDRSELYSLIELLDPTLFTDPQDLVEHTDELAGLNRTVDMLRRWPGLSDEDRVAAQDAAATWLERDAAPMDAQVGLDTGRESIIEELLDRHRLSRAMVRNRKTVVGGFQPRQAVVWSVELTPAEREAYEAVTEYVRTGYTRSQETQSNALGFLMTVFQKLNASSSRALRRSLERRIERLEKGLTPAPAGTDVPDEQLEEQSTAEALEGVVGVVAGSTVLQDLSELRRVVALLKRVEVDSKTRVLVAHLNEIAAREAEAGRPAKVIIFTQFRDTQEYLREHISGDWGVELFHGQLTPQEKDASVERFRRSRGPCALISTESGGEGRNFQFCSIIVNYDLPWNPMRVEQRIGRIDRIGQSRPVTIINFSVKGTIEDRVLQVLGERIRVFEETVGGLDPILGEVEQDLKRVFALGEAERDRALRELELRLESRVRDARRAERQRGDFIMDTRSFRQEEVQRLLRAKDDAGSLDNKVLRRFAVMALDELGVTIEDERGTPGVSVLRLRGRFAQEFPEIEREGHIRRVTFDPAVAREQESVEFLAFGHPIIDGLVARVRGRNYPGRASHRVVVTDEREPIAGWFFTYVLEFEGVVRAKEVFPVFISAAGVYEQELSTWLLARALEVRHEDRGRGALPLRGADFERGVAAASEQALRRLISRQAELAAINQQRLEQERSRVERLFDHRSRAARDKLEAVRATLERLSASDEADVQRIVPAWVKNLENATRVVEGLEEDRLRRLGELAGRDQVSAQHGLLTASYVEIQPDPTPLLGEIRRALPAPLFDRLRSACRWSTDEDLAAWATAVTDRRKKLRALASSHRFDSEVALRSADALLKLIAIGEGMGARERFVLSGAVDYFLKIEDEEHDLTGPTGFEDDRKVVNAAAVALGHPELAIRRG
jgi:SNF2 family DNA or RNA helicase